MPQDDYSFAQTRIRLEEIVSQVRKKEVSLDRSLDLLEEGVRLANQCTELIDRADWDAAAGGGEVSEAADAIPEVPRAEGALAEEAAEEPASEQDSPEDTPPVQDSSPEADPAEGVASRE